MVAKVTGLTQKIAILCRLVSYLPEMRASDAGQVLQMLHNNAHHSAKLACNSLQLAPCYPLLHTLDLSEKELSWSAGTFIRRV
jgi:hypothetical protein